MNFKDEPLVSCRPCHFPGGGKVNTYGKNNFYWNVTANLLSGSPFFLLVHWMIPWLLLVHFNMKAKFTPQSDFQKIDERENGKNMSFMRNLSPFSSILQTKYWKVPASSFCRCYSKFSCWKPFPKKQRGQRQKAARVHICWKIDRKSTKLSMATITYCSSSCFMWWSRVLSPSISTPYFLRNNLVWYIHDIPGALLSLLLIRP